MSRNRRVVGILGGMGPEATLLLMSQIIAMTPAEDDDLLASGVDVLLIACTELSLIKDAIPAGARAVDALDVLASAITASSREDDQPARRVLSFSQDAAALP